MKKAYLFIGLFTVWCLISAFWYMFWVKGLSPNPEHINPHESAFAIAEILLIALISLLLGFAIAWYLRADSIAFREEQVDDIRMEANSIGIEIQTTRAQLRKAEHTLARARETFREDFFTVTREKERLRTELETNKGEIVRLHSELLTTQTSLQNLQQIDDLQEIKGIGPVIEKKLNILGIVSFKQVSELTDGVIEQISHNLKFFPDRIRRDQWVKQATELYRLKIAGAEEVKNRFG